MRPLGFDRVEFELLISTIGSNSRCVLLCIIASSMTCLLWYLMNLEWFKEKGRNDGGRIKTLEACMPSCDSSECDLIKESDWNAPRFNVGKTTVFFLKRFAILNTNRKEWIPWGHHTHIYVASLEDLTSSATVRFWKMTKLTLQSMTSLWSYTGAESSLHTLMTQCRTWDALCLKLCGVLTHLLPVKWFEAKLICKPSEINLTIHSCDIIPWPHLILPGLAGLSETVSLESWPGLIGWLAILMLATVLLLRGDSSPWVRVTGVVSLVTGDSLDPTKSNSRSGYKCVRTACLFASRDLPPHGTSLQDKQHQRNFWSQARLK